MPKKFLFSESDLANLRQGFYTQAPTVAALLAGDCDMSDDDDVLTLAKQTVNLIEALVEEIGEIEP